MDILKPKYRERGKALEVYPSFIVNNHSQDIMTRANDFYAIWDEESQLWLTDEQIVINRVDDELKKYAEEVRAEEEKKAEAQDRQKKSVKTALMIDSDSGAIDKWHKFVQKQLRANFCILNQHVFFSNQETHKEDYASFKLPYPLAKGDISAYDELVGTLYDPGERRKIEWAIGSVIAGDSKKIQKFLVFYGKPGAGKGTIMDIIRGLFKGYTTSFIAKEIVKESNSFSLEPFRNNPLVGIQSDGNLSRIIDNSQLNTLISHEELFVAVKHRDGYFANFNTFLFLSSNYPVQITDSLSGLIRRLIDVYPSGKKIPRKRYDQLINDVTYEYGAIAYHCLEVYNSLGYDYYDDYIPEAMIKMTNPVYGFVDAYLLELLQKDGFTLKELWKMYSAYAEEAKLKSPMRMMDFQNEIKNYFSNFEEDVWIDKSHLRKYYSGFIKDKFTNPHDDVSSQEQKDDNSSWIVLKSQPSLFDSTHGDCVAQYANQDDKPSYSWDNVSTRLCDIDTSKCHYAMLPENEVVLDFDHKNPDGSKSLEKNIEAASEWAETYCEVSKGGGLHLHYYYTGDIGELSRFAGENVEVKFKSLTSDGFKLRRKLTLCNDIPIKEISSGLPKAKRKECITELKFENEKHLRNMIARCLEKKHHGHTAPEVDYIKKILDDAYADESFVYDIRDLTSKILSFALSSHNQSVRCLDVVSQMHFCCKSAESCDRKNDIQPIISGASDEKKPIVIFDTEVFKNLFVICWKKKGKGDCIHSMINPTAGEVRRFVESYRIVGYNCRKYDNHMLYAAMLGYTNMELYRLSQDIISKKKDSYFAGAYNLSYTDVFDFLSEKKSLKWWEIKLKIKHLELGRFHIKWDQTVEEKDFPKVALYCGNDVAATEAVWDANEDDWIARQILADIAGMSVNTTTNTLTTKIIFGDEKNPDLVYTDLKTGRQWNSAGEELPYDPNNNNQFPDYEFKYNPEDGKYHNMYKDIDVGFGGRIFSLPGYYENVALLDSASHHPTSAENLNAFGKYTKRYSDLKRERIFIKHKEFDKAKDLFEGKLAKYLIDPKQAKKLAKALKLAINSVYGLTSAKFDNPFRDTRNKNNIVALRGALFMCVLQEEVEKRGYKVIHIKTDSIKIPNADDYIINFVIEFGRKYGYEFEHESTYKKMVLLNDADYIAYDADFEGPIGYDSEGVWRTPWTATGDRFSTPFLFKAMFSKEPISFEDYCEFKSSKTALYLDENEGYPDVSQEEHKLSTNESRIKSMQKRFAKKYGDNIPEEELNKIKDIELENAQLKNYIPEGHNYQFIGKYGQFTPVVPGVGGGGLYVEASTGTYNSAQGAKGYLWMESDDVIRRGLQEYIDKGYYGEMVDKALDDIGKYIDYHELVA